MLGTEPSIAAVLAAFIALEEREHWFARTLLGVRYWELIRNDLFRETLEALGLAERAHLRVEELPVRSWLGPQLRNLPRTLARSHFRHAQPAELLVAPHSRLVSYQGRFICPYSQPLLWGTPRSRLLLQGHFQGRYFAPDAAERTRYIDLSLLLAHARFRLRELSGAGLPAQEVGTCHEIADQLTRALGAGPSRDAVLRRARTAVLMALGLTPRLEQLLDAVRPRLVVEVVGYRLVNQLLTRLAHQRNIPVAELQHGTLGPLHAGYNFAKTRRPSGFPDYLLLFGALSRTSTPGLPLPVERCPAIGYGFLDLQRAAFPRAAHSGKRRVLFLSQRGIGRELSKIAAAVSGELSGADFEFCYRLHPSESLGWQAAYPELASSGMRVEHAAERALYASQNATDVQVGVYSTALLEGVSFGLETVLVALPGHEQLALLTQAGLARCVPDVGTLASSLRDPQPLPAHAGDTLFQPNAAANFARFVDDLLG